jgi:hypothetical protein
MDWSKFTPKDFEYDFERDELAAHRVTFQEALIERWAAKTQNYFPIEASRGQYHLRKQMGSRDRARLILNPSADADGTDFFTPQSIVRIITGWAI